MILLAVALAGGLGAAGRFLVDAGLRARWPGSPPWPTLLINVSASLLLGLLAGAVAAGSAPAALLTVAGTGFCGGYSTFSTAAVELARLLGDREQATAAAYAAGTLLLPVLAATLGYGLAGRLAQ